MNVNLNCGMQKYILRPVLAVLIVLLGTSFVSPTPTGEYSVIDQYARATPERYARNLTTLSQYLTAPARSDLAKARSVYSWIMSHVRYEDAAGANRLYSSEVEYANRVLRSRQAVCTGFALLYKHLLKQAGVEVINVKGYARADDAQAGQPTGPIDHEWNAIRLDGDWYLVDLAWASTTAHNGQPNDYYFLTDPSAFVAQHLPADPRWQLRNPVVSKAEFDRFPKLYDAYFRLGFDENFPKMGLVRTSDAAVVQFHTPENVEFFCSSGRPSSDSSSPIPVSVQRSGDTYTLQVKMPQRGLSTLYVFAKPKEAMSKRSKSYEGIASFTVVKE